MERAVMVFFGVLDDVVDVEGTFGGQENLVDDLHVGFALGIGVGRVTELGAAQGAQGAKLSERGVFEDVEEVVFGQRVHRVKEKVVMGRNL
jgi:hypothetical protein